MTDLADGQSVEFQGSARQPYILKNVGGVFSCSCPAWKHQSIGIEWRSCKHLRQLRGEDAERSRVGGTSPGPVAAKRARKTNAMKPVAPPLLLAQSWSVDIDPAGWSLSEKLDGVRGFWDGKHFLGGLQHPNGAKADPHMCSDMWLTGAPLHNPKPGPTVPK